MGSAPMHAYCAVDKSGAVSCKEASDVRVRHDSSRFGPLIGPVRGTLGTWRLWCFVLHRLRWRLWSMRL